MPAPLSVCRPREIEFRADLVGGYYSIMILGLSSKLPELPTYSIAMVGTSSLSHPTVQAQVPWSSLTQKFIARMEGSVAQRCSFCICMDHKVLGYSSAQPILV